ncbi:MAG: SUMF1/EgtB/PvdO family nonheme iron enzyme [Opitutales bacterium]|nr:SUMF1/EgtB/PvdO family nonheme iron enzyme [Opitutales bacterium]
MYNSFKNMLSAQMERFGISRATILLFVVFLTLCIAFILIVFIRADRNSDRNISAMLESDACVELASTVVTLRADMDAYYGGAKEQNQEYWEDLCHKLLNARDNWVRECNSGVESDDFYPALRRRYETGLASEIMQELSLAMQAGEQAIAENDYKEALRQYSIAHRMQLDINSRLPSAEQASAGRLASISKMLDKARYEPMLEDYRVLIAKADSSYDNEDYEQAKELYIEARTLLTQLSYRIPQSYLNAGILLSRIDRQMADCGAKIRKVEIDEIRNAAQVMANANDFTGASEQYARALDVQRSLARDFPNSNLASESNIRKLELERQNTLARPWTEAINEGMLKLNASLDERDYSTALNTISELMLKADHVKTTFPDADFLRDQSMERIAYLYSIRGELPVLHRGICGKLLPVGANHEGVMMMDREVSQFLFEKICANNPSLTRGDNLPVEGITLTEARQFAKRAEWISGRKTRLPSLEEFMAVAKGIDPLFARKSTWNSSTVPERNTRPCGSSPADSNGFHDILGNVSEWAEEYVSDTDASYGFCVGGSVRDNPIRISELPQERHEADERVRNNGFRLVMTNAQ